MNEQEARRAWTSILTRDTGLAPRDAVLRELCDYSGLSTEEVQQIAATSNSITGQKWAEADRSTPEGMRQFYASVSNWVFGTLSYHARQAEGENTPLPVLVADALDRTPTGEFLDFGAGVGTASILFARAGWRVTAADVSPPLMAFAAWRFKQHARDIPIVDLNEERLAPERYDVVAGFNTMAHIHDVRPTIENLWRTLKPGGLLIFDIDSRKKSERMYWHVLQSHSPVLREMRRSGFKLERTLGPLYFYRRTNRPGDLARAYWDARDGLRYSAPGEWISDKRRRVIHRLRSMLGRR